MKSIIIIAFISCLSINGMAQEKIVYTKYGNIGDRTTYNDKDYLRKKPEVQAAYKALVGSWDAQEVNDLSVFIQFKERDLQGNSYYFDNCFANNISHHDFNVKFEMMIGGTGYDDFNNLDKIYFEFGPSEFINGVNQVYVSGFLHVLDANTLRMEIMGIEHPLGDDEEIVIRPDYKYETAPADIKARVPAVLRRKTITFKRKVIDLPPPPPPFDGDGPAGL